MDIHITNRPQITPFYFPCIFKNSMSTLFRQITRIYCNISSKFFLQTTHISMDDTLCNSLSTFSRWDRLFLYFLKVVAKSAGGEYCHKKQRIRHPRLRRLETRVLVRNSVSCVQLANCGPTHKKQCKIISQLSFPKPAQNVCT